MSKAKAEKKPEKGLSFPITSGDERSTSVTGKLAIAAALRAANTEEGTKFADLCANEKNWRFKYQKHFMNMVRLSGKSPEIALKIAQGGLDYMHNNFDFIDPITAESTKFSDYMARAKQLAPIFYPLTISGKSTAAPKTLVVPYKGKNLEGEALKQQLGKWVKYGTIEADAAYALGRLADGPVDLTGKHFVLIGAGSAMGPFIKLLQHGATVICIDIPGKWGQRPAEMWQKLINTAREGSGSIIIPVAKPNMDGASDEEIIQAAGCNLTEQPAEILNWLTGIAVGKPLTVGNYTYLDGELHVKLSLAADAIIANLCKTRGDTAVAFLCTPTDIHVIPDSAYAAAKKNYGWHPGKFLETFINLVSGGKFLKKNVLPPIECQDKTNLKIVDGLSVAQGPNYALAKRLQHWRAMIEYEGGHIVSSHIAPSTATLSVVSNKSFGWAYGGMPYFKPYEIFQQETTNAIMCGLLVSDVTSKDSAVSVDNKLLYYL